VKASQKLAGACTIKSKNFLVQFSPILQQKRPTYAVPATDISQHSWQWRRRTWM